MSHKETIEHLNNAKRHMCLHSSCGIPCHECINQKSFSDAIKAVKKQIGMKPKNVRIDGFWGFRCHRCKKQVWVDNLYCPNCGQRLDWEKELDEMKSISEWKPNCGDAK